MSVIVTVPTHVDMQWNFMRKNQSPHGTLEGLKLGIRLVDEEVNQELLEAATDLQNLWEQQPQLTVAELFASSEEASKVFTAVADGIVDSVYVLLQLSNALHMPFDELFAEVHDNNMRKPNTKDAEGKVIKPEDWTGPQLQQILRTAYQHQLQVDAQIEATQITPEELN